MARAIVPMPFQIQLAARMIFLDPNSSPKTKEQLATLITEHYLTADWAAQSLITLQPLSDAIIAKLEKQMQGKDSRIRMSAAETLYAVGKDVTKDLCSMLNDPIPDVRQRAFRLLNAQLEGGDNRVEEILINNITGGTGDLGQAAMRALTRLTSVGDETLQLMIRFLGKSDESLRKSIIDMLHRMGRDQNKVVTLMIRCLGKTTDEGREDLIGVLYDLAKENNFVEQTLIRFLRHGQPAARCAIIESADRIQSGSKEIIKCICERLHDPMPDVRSAAISKLITLVKSEEWIVSLLSAVLDSKNHQARRAAALVLIESDTLNDHSMSIITSWLDNPDWELRHCAIHALNSSNDDEGVMRSLSCRLADENEFVREAAADVLAVRMERSDASFTMLLELIYDPSVETREAAFRALLRYHDKTDKRLITALCEKLNDESVSIRIKAADWLGDSGTKSSLAVQALLVRLNDDDPEVRRSVATALGNLGLANPKILKPLENSAAGDTNEDVRLAARDAIRQLSAVDNESSDMMGHTVTLDSSPVLNKFFKSPRLFKQSAYVPDRH